MNLEYISKKINTILNDTTASTGNPLTSEFYFYVATDGYYLDSVATEVMIGSALKKRNIIPVFIGVAGGDVNAVEGLDEEDYSISMNIYFPIQFKEKFYQLYKYLKSKFVGKIVDFGLSTSSVVEDQVENALCNISIPRYTTIADTGLTEFKSWVFNTYNNLEIDTARYWMDMSMNLFLNTAKNLGEADGFIMGNAVKITSVSFAYNGMTWTDSNPIIIQRADMASSSPAVQQVFSETYTKGIPANAGYTKQLPLYVKNNTNYRSLLNICEVTKDIQNVVVTVTESLPFSTALTVTNQYFITDYSRATIMGELLGISFTLSPRRMS